MRRIVLIIVLGGLGALACGFFAKTSLQAHRAGESIVLPVAIMFLGMSVVVVASFALHSVGKWGKVRKQEIQTGILMSLLLVISLIIGRLLEGRV